MATLTIRKLSSRVVNPDAETALAAAPLVNQATRRLSGALDIALSRALAAAGLDDTAVIGLSRLKLRLRIGADTDVDSLARGWAEAIVETVMRALQDSGELARARAARTGGAGAIGSDDVAVFADLWSAQIAWLRGAAAGEPPPWWQDALGQGPSNAAAIIAEWITRAPARGAVALLDLLVTTPDLPGLLSPDQGRRLAAQWLARLRGVVHVTPRPQATDDESRGNAAFEDGVPSDLPEVTAAAIARIAPDRRRLYHLAAWVAHGAAWTPAIALGKALQVSPRDAATDPATTAPSTPPGKMANGRIELPDTAPIPPEPLHPTPRDTLAPEAASVQVMAGGLLLLLRPLGASGLLDELHGNALRMALLRLGLAALQRIATPLPLTARRVMLERDRPLLAIFAGAPPPDAPLDTLAPGPDAQARLDRLIARAPSGVAWAPGAIRRFYGEVDPFGDSPEGNFARLVLRPGRLSWTPWSADLTWPLVGADIALRRAGWDIDLGWLPWIGRTVSFHYDGLETP